MMELLKNAWLGWENYIADGKLIALFLAVLLFGWLYKKGTEQRAWLLYASVMTACCICPLTAAMLMTYQTKFYDYQWIWSAVPVTALVAYGIVLFLSDMWTNAGREQKRIALAVTLLVAGVLVLCGDMGKTGGDEGAIAQAREEKERAYEVMEQLGALIEEEAAEGDSAIVLWAPAEILEYAREADGSVKLLYGRNMWDAALNAYAYDVYSAEICELYTRMEEWGHPTGMKWEKKPAEYAQMALKEGVNCIMLPDSAAWATVLEMAEMLDATPQLLEDYWVLYGRAD